MYWKDELDGLYQKNVYGKRLWKQLVGNQVELLLRNNLRQVGTILEIAETQEGPDEQIPSMGCNIKWFN